MTKLNILNSVLAKTGLSGMYVDTDGALQNHIPVSTAKQLVPALEAAGLEASWAPDGDASECAWVYVTL